MTLPVIRGNLIQLIELDPDDISCAYSIILPRLDFVYHVVCFMVVGAP